MSYQLTHKKYLNSDEVRELERVLDLLEKREPRNVLALRLIFVLGCRVGEFVLIEKSDINHLDKTVLVKGLKGSNDREIPLPPKLYLALKRYAESLPADQERLYPVTTKQIQRIWQDYRPCKKGIHALRHTRGRLIYQNSKDVRVVQYWLGHKSIDKTMIYVDYQYKHNELRKLI